MGEILLGAKRPPRSRRVFRKLMVVALVLTGLAGGAYLVFRKATSFPTPAGKVADGALAADGSRVLLAGSSLEQLNGMAVLRLVGDSYVAGAVSGRLLAGAAVAADGALDVTVDGEDPDSGIFGATRHDMA